MSNLMDTIEPVGVNIIDTQDVMLITDKHQALYDLFNDVGVVGLGHDALQSVFEDLAEGEPYSIPAILGSKWRERAATELCHVMGYDKVFFCNSGTEAVEAAIKLARRYMRVIRKDERDTIYTLKGVFHGRTYGALTASDAAPYHKEGFEPFLPGFEHFSRIDEIDWNKCLAVMVTPAFVNKDVIVFPSGWLEELKHMCHMSDTLFIVDEIQTGFGRCGEWKLTDAYGIQPDIICVGKGLANGLPVGGILSTNEISRAFTPGRHFSTYGGLPIGMMAVCKVIETVAPMIQDKVIQDKSEYFMNKLGDLGFMTHIRGVGLLLAVDVKMNAKAFCQESVRHGVMIVTFDSKCIKMTPPLTITYQQIDDIINIFQHVYTEHIRIGLNR